LIQQAIEIERKEKKQVENQQQQQKTLLNHELKEWQEKEHIDPQDLLTSDEEDEEIKQMLQKKLQKKSVSIRQFHTIKVNFTHSSQQPARTRKE
jgi:hypothetical protein